MNRQINATPAPSADFDDELGGLLSADAVNHASDVIARVNASIEAFRCVRCGREKEDHSGPFWRRWRCRHYLAAKDEDCRG